MLIAQSYDFRSSLSPRQSPSPRRTPSSDGWKRHFSLADAITVGHGSSGIVYAIDQKKVIKVFTSDEEGMMDLEREWMIYDKLQRDGKISTNIVWCEEQWASGLILERLVGTLRQHLRTIPQTTTPPSARQWVRESCEGLAFLHEHGILHSDLGCQNILLDIDGHAKLCDFAGSKIGDEKSWISYEVRGQHPDYVGKQPTIKTEIFALGSVIFEIWTCLPPYASESHAVVRQNFRTGQFPLSSIEDPTMQAVVAKCWKGIYNTVPEVIATLGIDLDSALGSIYTES